MTRLAHTRRRNRVNSSTLTIARSKLSRTSLENARQDHVERFNVEFFESVEFKRQAGELYQRRAILGNAVFTKAVITLEQFGTPAMWLERIERFESEGKTLFELFEQQMGSSQKYDRKIRWNPGEFYDLCRHARPLIRIISNRLRREVKILAKFGWKVDSKTGKICRGSNKAYCSLISDLYERNITRYRRAENDAASNPEGLRRQIGWALSPYFSNKDLISPKRFIIGSDGKRKHSPMYKAIDNYLNRRR